MILLLSKGLLITSVNNLDNPISNAPHVVLDTAFPFIVLHNSYKYEKTLTTNEVFLQ